METRASYILVGAAALFALILFAGILVFAVKTTGDSNEEYLVVFKGSVAGLSIGNDVRFNGIRVGQVSQIKIDPSDPGVVNVMVSIAEDTPVRENSEATLEMQGITGLAVVAITGGTPDSPHLKPRHNEEFAQIRAGRSRLEHIIDEAPDLLVSANQLLQRGSSILSPENQKNLSITLESMAKVSSALARQSDAIESTIVNLNEASTTMNRMLKSVDRAASFDIPAAMSSTKSAFNEMQTLLKQVRPGMERFTQDGLDEFNRLMVDANKLVRSLDNLVQKVDNDPRRFFFGDNVPEYRVK